MLSNPHDDKINLKEETMVISTRSKRSKKSSKTK